MEEAKRREEREEKNKEEEGLVRCGCILCERETIVCVFVRERECVNKYVKKG